MPLNRTEEKIKNFLLKKKLIAPERWTALEAKAEKEGRSLEETLVKEKIFSPADFNALKGEIFGWEAADLSERTVDPKVLGLLAQKVAQNYQMVIFDRFKNAISVGMVNPDDFQAHEAIEFMATQQGLEPRYFVISFSDFSAVLRQYGGFKKEIVSAIESAKVKFAEKEEALKGKAGADATDLGQIIKSAPVAKIVSVIINHAVEGGASDIHIEPGHNEGRVRYRIDGVLNTTLTLPSYLYNAVISRIKVLSNLKLDETRLPQDGRFRIKLESQEVDLRVSVLPTLDSEKVVMRVLDNSAGVPTLSELGFSDYHTEIIERNIKKPYGIVLLTGPTGSGKTTTLYSILNIINSDNVNITTLEDPVEYYITGVNQSQINSDIGFSFAGGLRAILRQDPNVIMVGEIRDTETVELVIHAGLTGHLVFSTLHTNNAWGAIPRLMDMKAEPFLLASTLNLVMAQRLIRRICPQCQEEVKLAPKIQDFVDQEITRIPKPLLADFGGKFIFRHGRGCANCGNSGYAGRMVAGEIIEVGPELKDLIVRDFTQKSIEEQLAKQNYVTLVQDGIIKALRGFTSIEEVIRIAQDI